MLPPVLLLPLLLLLKAVGEGLPIREKSKVEEKAGEACAAGALLAPLPPRARGCQGTSPAALGSRWLLNTRGAKASAPFPGAEALG
jgi:hypothetical protein